MTDSKFHREDELLQEIKTLRQRVAELESMQERLQEALRHGEQKPTPPDGRESENGLSQQLQFLQQLLDTIPLPVFYKNHQGIYQGCNRAFEEFFGLLREQIIGKTVDDLAPRELAKKYREGDRGTAATTRRLSNDL